MYVHVYIYSKHSFIIGPGDVILVFDGCTGTSLFSLVMGTCMHVERVIV